MGIDKRIITIWIGPEMPDLVKKCIESQKIQGYEHVLIDNSNYYHCEYVDKCIERKSWVRAADYLRLYYLNELGGIYLDADTEVTGNFDKFLNNGMFVFKESSGYLNNGFIGSEKDHPFLKFVLTTMEHNFGFDQDLFFPGMQFFCESYFIAARKDLGMEIYDDSELNGVLTHHGMKSWK